MSDDKTVSTYTLEYTSGQKRDLQKLLDHYEVHSMHDLVKLGIQALIDKMNAPKVS